MRNRKGRRAWCKPPGGNPAWRINAHCLLRNGRSDLALKISSRVGGGGTWHLSHCNHPALEFLAFRIAYKIAHRVFSRFDSASSKRSWSEIRRDSKVPRSWVRALGALRFAYIRTKTGVACKGRNQCFNCVWILFPPLLGVRQISR